MKITIHSYHSVAYWKWDISSDEPHKLHNHLDLDDIENGYINPDDPATMEDDDEDDEVCGICQNAFEGCCPECKVPGDDCPLIWGECTHVFHMHCLLKWIDTESSKQQCPMDRRPWVTADRKPDKLSTTSTGQPVAQVAPGPLPTEEEGGVVMLADLSGEADMDESEQQEEGEGESMEVDGR
ncbi:anaphase-promoting complex subunit 11 [Kwoniella mangroviensis CBS 10435]|uniref:Anaphase-promoting complex subunit 11 n=1 Tax=Kwoniella mangroviensis CBS 10435 TaxID=1331196 RepID=A0A1B9IX15_9TREE|nr:anaphase-promoting complex subunit 11 [Kwoniella mangroviensis CBS 8507]OCF60071.1 anaphase-promoting complex subunit 11 [Kwoniella mangroviensis CBS 10435]OCF69556.1 anaphase-promoting complex subunit 11 [Kwoniella mangroviensis CBS 8507]OCF70988.1 anaphase-promoting complex subunit 11 [Kwoniella mangroviensis CBS 8886]